MRKRISMKTIFSSIVAFSLVVISSEISLGQTTGKIEGSVRDSDSGTLLVGAQVTIEGTRLGNITNEDGNFFILNVPAGLHNVKARLIGYQAVTVTDQRVLAGQTHQVNFNLKSTVIELPGQFVEGERSPLVPRDNTVTKHRITFETAQALPVDDYQELVTLQAGIVRLGGNISVRGGRTTENAGYVDGVSAWIDIPEFGIEEIDVITGNYSSEFGNAQSGVFNIVTPEGGRELRGKLRLETEELNPSASNYGYNKAQISIGGPIPATDHLTFYFSSDVTGKGDRSPRAAGFKGTTEDLFDVAGRFSNADEAGDFLGHDLDLVEMLRTAGSENPSLPILNLTELRRQRFGGRDYEGRLPGNVGDEYRIQGKVSYQPSRNTRLIGTYLEEREQGVEFSLSQIFWTEERNLGFTSRNQLGIIGYEQTLSQTASRSHNISVRASYQRIISHSGSLFAPYDTTSVGAEMAGRSLGYHDQMSLFNFRFGDIPIFASDLWSQTGEQAVLFTGVTSPSSSWGDNPFGIPIIFSDSNRGIVNSVSNNQDDRATFRFDLDSQLNPVHRLRGGVEARFWYFDRYSSALSTSGPLNYYSTNPNMESFYVEDRLDYQDLVIDLGLRVDSFYAGTDYPAVFGDQSSARITPKRKTEVAPRLGVAHPVTDRTQVRLSYGTKLQLPDFSNLYDAINVDVDQQGNNFSFGNPDLGFSKTTSFEVGFTTLLSDDWVLDITGYNRDFDGNIAARYLKQEDSYRYLRIFSSVDHGNVRGMETTLRKRFGDFFSTDLAYTFMSSKSTGTDPNDFVNNEGRFVVGEAPPLPPVQPAPNDYDQTHTFTAQFNLQFPGDFREGTRLHRILNNTGLYMTLQANSGRPYTRQDFNFDFAEENNLSRRGWQSLVNLRVTRDFRLGGLDYTAFADVRNLFDADILSERTTASFAGAGVSNGVYQTTGSPFTDGKTISDALDYMGIATPELYIGPEARTPTDIDGDGDRDEADRAEIIRRLDMNGDGRVTVEEEFAMAILATGARDANSANFDIPRLFRVGLEVQF